MNQSKLKDNSIWRKRRVGGVIIHDYDCNSFWLSILSCQRNKFSPSLSKVLQKTAQEIGLMILSPLKLYMSLKFLNRFI